MNLPLSEPAAQKVAGREKAVLSEEESSAARPKKQFVAPDAHILVVDDNAYNRRVISGFLEPALIQIDDVESGFEALEMIDIKDYDLVLMDLRMPKMDGAETLRRIQTEYPDFHAPVVVLTADIMNGVEERLLSCGFAGFLAKPVSSAKLLDTIADFIREKVVYLNMEDDKELTISDVERYQDMLLSFGINLRLALEYNAGNTGEFLTRAALFAEYAEAGMEKLQRSVGKESYYLQVHSIKSVARGVGAYLLAELAETAEFRRDPDFSEKVTPLLLNEYQKVREGLEKILGEVEYDGT